MILPIILSFSSFSNANIREIYDIAKGFLVFNTSGVPQIWLSLRPPIFNSQIHTDFFDLSGLEFERVTQISQMTQIFLTYSVRFTQIFRLPCPPLRRGAPYPTPKPSPLP